MSAPRDFEEYWRARASRVLPDQDVRRQPADVITSSSRLRCEYLSYLASDGVELHARYLQPKQLSQGPCVVVFHDVGRPQRGWFYLSRFVSLGYSVFAPEMRLWSGNVTRGWQNGPDALELAQIIEDALLAVSIAATQTFCARAGLMLWGEGLGGALALDSAALSSILVSPAALLTCAALNPSAANWRQLWESDAAGDLTAGLRRYFREVDPRGITAEAVFNTLSYVDTRSFASFVTTQTLVGRCLMDTEALPSATKEVVSALAGNVTCVDYPKYDHERVNDFENKLLAFMHL